MFNTRQIEAFRAVMQAGTVTAAAERLRISQPAVSRLIALLEARSRLKLFVRRQQRLHPTPEAVAFYREVERSFIGLEKLERAAANISNLVTGTLRIVSLPSLGLGFVPHVIRDFKRRHPEISITLQTRSSNTVLDWTASSNFDFGLIGATVDLPQVHAEEFAAPAGICIVPESHRLANARRITPRDLVDEEFISLDPVDPNRVRIDEVFRQAGIRRRMTIETPYGAAVCAMVCDGLGVSIVSPFTADDFTRLGMKVIPFTPTIPFPTLLIWSKQQPLSKIAQTFIGFLKEQRDGRLDAYAAAASS
ncbi:MAG: LysR family transcriptional regulator [Proteobacteria bacterium]|nr:LysR family transcriptional regulator [Pseudomonadota bacterium]